jgi:hypothetical protein
MNKRLNELKKERANVLGKLFVARCAIALFTVLVIVRFVFEKPITVSLLALWVVLVPCALLCYDKLVANIGRDRS